MLVVAREVPLPSRANYLVIAAYTHTMGLKQQDGMRVLALQALLVFAAIIHILHKPLPHGFVGHGGRDRLIMSVVEPVLRLSYLYPVRLGVLRLKLVVPLFLFTAVSFQVEMFCSDARCRLEWTRGALSTLAAVFGPWMNTHPSLDIETTTFDGTKVRGMAAGTVLRCACTALWSARPTERSSLSMAAASLLETWTCMSR